MSDLLSAPALETLPERGMPYPPSSHMQLGCGLSNVANTRRSSCFEMGTCFDEEIESSDARPSLSDTDIASLLGTSDNIQTSDNQSKQPDGKPTATVAPNA